MLGCDTQLAEKGYDAYLLGEFNTTGFWNYFLVGFLVKTPVPILVLVVLAVALKPKITAREVPMLLRMFEKRLRGYRAIGYARGEAPLGYAEPADDRVIEYDEDVLASLEQEDDFA